MYCPACGTEGATTARFCTKCGKALGVSESLIAGPPGLLQPAVDLDRIKDLRSRIADIEARIPNSNIVNPKFWPRAFTVFGHNAAVTIVIYAVIFAIVLGIGLLTAIAAS